MTGRALIQHLWFKIYNENGCANADLRIPVFMRFLKYLILGFVHWHIMYQFQEMDYWGIII